MVSRIPFWLAYSLYALGCGMVVYFCYFRS